MTGRALFVVLEGGEGAGKSTQAGILGDWLRSSGREVVTTREPGATPVGAGIRTLLLDGGAPDPRTEALLYAADRAEHSARVIRPALARGAVVISDRYVDSSVAYQAGGRGLASEDIVALTRWATSGLEPDLVLVLDLPPEVGLSRARARSESDRMEGEPAEFHESVRRVFLKRAAERPDRYVVVDANRPASEVAADLRAAVEARLGT
jgi:dTMP kinase